ncbi:D-inositol-3-phosphate glycosyltransferase [Flavobacterium bizetiae]|uniref:D-inositol-3-phosphate glycosyltransferase n=1 Tax=Flavobacterium bizetiae TaxID=2704140 RepID=A0A6J4GZ27_9FLAO|nr:glycosyltransferase [Flavobacterium bizetiae]CAA9203660.1 D-inositol-3-phosphate glycosyltransferase [Flavobacterium bizetiae]CAD5344725.1 D-inositol-3-phosphate glycosyltransferase [Flavobacterium bizetiae]CAD5350990.1 D-inositol-3-phosphate glycosyltransferase [Flavobacterium bizetiae]
MKKTIVINATALSEGGALTILKQFLNEIPKDDFEYLVFVPESLDFISPSENVRQIPVAVKSFLKRIIWDLYGVNNWLRKKKINYVSTISLQNTNFRVDKQVSNFVYYHQPTPLFHKNWNPFSARERRLWFYKNIYPYLVKAWIDSKTQFFVQLKFVKEAFIEAYGVDSEKIHVIEPLIETISGKTKSEIEINQSKFNVFFPAAAFVYKNHEVILDALLLLNEDSRKQIVLHLTGCTAIDFEREVIKKIEKLNVILWGKIKYDDIIELYKKVDVMVFPSYIETFGLPLTEAASFGVPIIAADLPYANEVLDGYKGVSFAIYNNPDIWKEKILVSMNEKGKRHDLFIRKQGDSWDKMFEIVKESVTSAI